jgi:AcrR family transcriptional regulator
LLVPRGRYQQKQWEDRQAAILETLEKLSTERGFANVTMDDVSDAVGISKATLYQHFQSKDAMLVHLLAQHEDHFLDWLTQTDDQPPLDRLRQIMQQLMDGHIMPLRGLFSLSQDEVLPVFRSSEDLMQRHDQIVDKLSSIIRQGQAESVIAADLIPESVIGAMLALSSVSMGSYEPPTCADQIRQTYREQMILLFERAIRP